jgi:hypothetical protein
MGGIGSGRWGLHSKRRVVEDCLSLDVNKLVKHGQIQTGSRVSSSVTWKDCNTGEIMSSAGAVSDTRTRITGTIRLTYTVPDMTSETSTRIHLTSTTLPWGKPRWWFSCPLSHCGHMCQRRASKLYLPPSKTLFGCRHCHDLTYTSCQEAHMYDRLWRNVASEFGMSADAAERLGVDVIWP